MIKDYKVGDRLIIPDEAFEEDDISYLCDDKDNIVIKDGSSYVALTRRKGSKMYVVIGYMNEESLKWIRELLKVE